MSRNREEYDWLEDPFDEAKNAQEREELDAARRKSRTTVIVLLAVLAVAVLVGCFSCVGISAVYLGSDLSA